MEVLDMGLSAEGHFDDDQLDRFCLGTMPEDELSHFEEHLLLCEPCQRRVEENDAFVAAMRSAAVAVGARPEKRHSSWRFFLRPVWGIAFAGILAVGFFVWNRAGVPAGQAPVAVALQAMRGPTVAAEAPAGRPLLLIPDMAGIGGFSSYRLEIVDPSGALVWSAEASGPQPQGRVSSLRSGTYFVRIYGPAGELLREYGLAVK